MRGLAGHARLTLKRGVSNTPFLGSNRAGRLDPACFLACFRRPGGFLEWRHCRPASGRPLAGRSPLAA